MAKCILAGLSGKVVPGPLLLIALLCVHCESAEGVLVQTPTNTTVIANHSTFFNCSKSNNKSTEPSWYHYPLDGNGKDRQDVYDDEEIRDKYKDRFSIEKNLASGTYNLLVQRPEPTDGGRYECVEDSLEEDTGASAELTVLDTNLVCESDKDLNEIVGPTECDKPIAPDQLQLSCSVSYSGNVAPQMQLRKVGNALESIGIPNCGVRGNRVMCNATLKANLNMDGSVYICQIITAEQYSCSLKVNKTIYTFSDTSVRANTTTEEAFCSANTSKDLPCSYKWYKDNKTEQLGQTLKPSNPGIYNCEAECKIRNETCAFTAMVISASEPVTWNPKLLGVLVLLIISLGVIVAALVYFKRKKNRGAQPGSQPQPASLQNAEGETEMLVIPSAPPAQAQPAPSPNGQEQDEIDAIRKVFNTAPHLGKGLSGGEICGPMQYKGIQCAFQEIKYAIDNDNRTNVEEITKQEKIFTKGREWMALNNKNLIKYYDVFKLSGSVVIVMEYAGGGSLRRALNTCKERLPMPVVKDWATQIAQGMNYLHEYGIIHRGLNCARILIVELSETTDVSNKSLKILQFRHIEDSHTTTHGEKTFSFSAPEVFQGKYVKASDVWSFGTVVWAILTREEPYADVTGVGYVMEDARNEAKHLKIPDWCCKELKEILDGCRRETHDERPSFSEIIKSLQAWKLI